jgi:dUTP diphosphatase
VKVKFKKLHPLAVIPTYAKNGDAGLDLTAIDMVHFINENIIEYSTGLSIEIPGGYVGLVFSRSSIWSKDLILSNSVGVIDSGYRGEIKFKFHKYKLMQYSKIYAIGDRIGQLLIIPYPQIELEEVNELSESERGTGGFGSTGD